MSIRTTLECWGLHEFVEDAVQVVSELVTNSVQHAAGQSADDPGCCRLTVQRPTHDVVAVIVSDSSPRRPVRCQPNAESENGRGMLLLDALAPGWRVIPTPSGGKAVHCELRAHS
ncbi:ATP-binding protein [Streptomyces sp. NR30]|uniref:ATP-binding protein n=2 Tax=Streptomyces guryensis TaxID=2886947 RepID=A0A9Q3Z4A6_9ACTN|nr:ATP-binding protein [Streptomyces guryensis]